MDIRQRVIGAVVVVSLAIIFIPMLLEKPHENGALSVEPMPPPPNLPRFTVERAVAPELGRASGDRLGEVGNGGAESGAGGEPPDEGAEEPLSAAAAQAKDSPPQPDPRPPASPEPGNSQGQSAPGKAPSSGSESSAGGFRIVEPGASPSVPAAPAAPSATGGTGDFRLDAEGRAVGWSFQIGTFRNRGSATAIRDELMANKTGGYVQDFRGADGQVLTRVFAGPFLERKQAEAAKADVDKRYKVSSLVVQYRPSQ